MIRFGFININGLSGKGKSVIKVMKQRKLDIMILVETWLRKQQSAPLRGAYVDIRIEDEEIESKGGRRGREGIMVLIRKQLQQNTRITKISETKRWTTIQVQNTWLTLCYFPPSCDDEEIEQMFEYMYQHPEIDPQHVLFVGDFNARHRTWKDSRNNQRGVWLNKYIQETGLSVVLPERGKWTTFNNQGQGVTDLIIRQSPFHIDEYQINEEESVGGSDHRLLQWKMPAEVRASKNTYERWNIRKLERSAVKQEYIDSLTRNFQQVQEITSEILYGSSGQALEIRQRESILDRVYNAIERWLNEAASTSMGRVCFDVHEAQYEFETEEIKEQAERIEDLTRELTTSKTRARYQETWNILSKVKMEIKENHKLRRKEIFEQTAQLMASVENRPKFLKMGSCLRARDRKENCMLDPSKMNEHTAHFLTTFGGTPNGVVDFDPQALPNPFDGTVSCQHVTISDEKLTYLKKIIHGYKNGKTPGPDDIFAEMIKMGGDMTLNILAKLFETCEKWVCIPSIWRKANVTLIYKKKGDPTHVTNHRPISLTCVLRRLYERFIINKFIKDIDNILEIEQGGFREGRNTLQQVFALDQIMKRKPQLYHAFLDIKAAYDTVDRRMLWKDMMDHQMDRNLIANLRILFDQNSCNLVLFNSRSRDIKCKRGLFQGSTISPMLFNIYINSLIRDLNQLNKVSTHGTLSNNLFFADDGALHAQDASTLQAMLNKCDEWARQRGIQFAANKSVILAKDKQCTFRINNATIPQEEKFKYLGIEMNTNGILWGNIQASRISAMNNMANWLRSKGMNGLGWRATTSATAYKAFLRPMMEYGMGLGMGLGMDAKVMDAKVMDRMQLEQNKILRNMMNVKRNTSTGAIHRILNIELIKTRAHIVQAKFLRSLDTAREDVPARTIYKTSGQTQDQQEVSRKHQFSQNSSASASLQRSPN